MHGSAQHTALVPASRSVYAGLQILNLDLSTGLWKQHQRRKQVKSHTVDLNIKEMEGHKNEHR